LFADLLPRYGATGLFAGVDVLFVQHHLGPFIGRLNAMLENGMDPARAWFVDIPYSTHVRVIEHLIEMGVPAEHVAPRLDHPLACYDSAQAGRSTAIMNAISERGDPRPLMVIDDGAYFTRYLNRLREEDPARLDRFVGTSIVEQTTRGHRYLFMAGLEVVSRCKLSVVSIARSRTKIDFEGPFIGAAISRAVKRSIGKERISAARNVAVIGYGVVGEATVRELTRATHGGKIFVVDIDADARERAAASAPNCVGVPQLPSDRLYDIVVGCTGYNSFHLGQRELLADGAILVSGSSAAVEFNRAGFIELADRFPDDEIEVLDREATIAKGLHAEIALRQEGGKTFSFLNAGFPVNFDGRLECLPTKVIQATHGMLFVAGVQAMRQAAPGINTLDPEDDAWIYEQSLVGLESMCE